MTQGQLAKAIAKEFFLSQVDAAAVLDSILASFALGRTEVLWKPVLGVATALGLASTFLALRARKRYPVDYQLARPEKPKPS